MREAFHALLTEAGICSGFPCLTICTGFPGLGGLLGNVIPWNIKGIGFVMTTMFVVIFLEQLMKEKQHITAVIGAISAVLCRILFGADNFLLPTMFLILLLLTLGRKKIERGLE